MKFNRNIPNEEFRDIFGLEGKYQISRSGVVIRLPRIVKMRNNLDKRLGPMVLRSKFNPGTGYETYTFYVEGRIICKDTHRMLAQCYVPNPQNKEEVNHKDGDKLNNDLSNLEWVTHGENGRHAYRVLGRINPQLGKTRSLCPSSKKVVNTITKEIYGCYADAADSLSVKYNTLRNYLSGKSKRITLPVERYDDYIAKEALKQQ